MVRIYIIFVALAGSAVYLGQKLSPKMLMYRLKVRPFPTIVKSKSGKFQLAVSTHVELYNENLLRLDIHAIAFDFYIRNHQDQLRHLGSMFDPFYMTNEELQANRYQRNGTNSSTTALWSVPAQGHITTRTKLIVSLRLWRALQSTWRLMKRLVRDGHLEMQSTGVAHIRTAAAESYSTWPFTISISCDNRVDLRLRGLEILSKNCAMYQVQPGWLDLLATAEQLRNSSLSETLIT